jgi:glycosyltransferase involved in cell wall biosynthesis
MTDLPKRMTVMHIDPERGWRGGQQQVAYLIENLAALGVNNILAARAGEPLARYARERHWPLIDLGSPVTAAPRFAARLRREGAAILHAHSSRGQNFGLLARLLAPRARLVVSRRVDFHRRRGVLNRWKYATPLVSRWIAISGRVREILIEDGVPPQRIALVYSGVDTGRFHLPRDPAAESRTRSRLGVGPGDLVVGNVGALVGHKDQATLLRALALALPAAPRLLLVIAGEGPLRPALEALAAHLGVSARVRMPGHLDALPEVFAAMDLFVMSSSTEGLGTSVIDAMAAGLPVVATAAGGIPELVRDGRNGLLVPPGRPEELARAIAQMAGDESLRRSCGEANRADAERFSARATAQGTLDVYRSILESQ